MVRKYFQERSKEGGFALVNRRLVLAGVVAVFAGLIYAAYPSVAHAQLSKVLQSRGFQGPPQGGATAQNSKVMPTQLQNVGIDQELSHQVPLDLVFHDETGKTVRLGDYFGTKPVILSLVYFNCPRETPVPPENRISTAAKSA